MSRIRLSCHVTAAPVSVESTVTVPTHDQLVSQLPLELRARVERLPANLQALYFRLSPFLKINKACEVRGGCSRGFLWERAGEGKVKFVKSGESATAPTLCETLSLLEDMATLPVVAVKPRHRKKSGPAAPPPDHPDQVAVAAAQETAGA
jgi:hypothetical protein